VVVRQQFWLDKVLTLLKLSANEAHAPVVN